MAVSLTYDDTLARVRIAVTSIDSDAENVHIERSIDQITWVTVRGGTAVPVNSGVANLDDYEFVPNVVNYYRVSQVDTGPTAHVGLGTAATAVNTSVSPGLPAGWKPGDTFLLMASIRNSGAGTVDTPTGYTPLVVSGNIALFGRRAQAGDTAPTVTFSGGVANADTIAQIYGVRNTEMVPVASDSQLNGSAQDIAYPALSVPVANCRIIHIGWKQDDATSIATLPSASENAEVIANAGDDALMVWDRMVQTTPFTVPSGSFVVTGGAAAISRSIVAAFRQADFIVQETETITPDLSQVWLKSLARPFLNRPVVVTDFSEVTRPSRSGLFEVVGRSAPVVVSEVRGSRRWSMRVRTPDLDAAASMDLMLASGDLQFVHVPSDCAVPGGYVVVGDTTESRPTPRSTVRNFDLPLTEVAPPGADVVGATITCQGVLNVYATCADVLAAHATCADLLELIGSPTDVVTS